MNTPILVLASLLSLQAFAQSSPVQKISVGEQERIVRTLLNDDMAKAAIRHNVRLGASCQNQVLGVEKTGEGYYNFDIRILCHFPDGPDAGGGATFYEFTGRYGDKSVVIQNIKIDYAG